MPNLDCRDSMWATSGVGRRGDAPRPSTRCGMCEGPLPVDPCVPDDVAVCDDCCPLCAPTPEGTR